MPREASRVLIVDDHPIVRRGLAQLIELESDLLVCGEANDADTATSAMDELEPDIALVDLMLNGASGTGLIKNLKTRHADIPILVISMHDEAVYAERVLRAGAHGYIMKEEATSQVLTALRRVLKGDVYVSERMAARLLRRMVGGGSDAVGVERLSDRELEVFQWIGRGQNVVEIAKRLNVSPKTVETYRAHIKDKLDLQSSAEVMRLAVQWFEQRNHA
jgi:DNA-binding NarL/FixJ family response regulator